MDNVGHILDPTLYKYMIYSKSFEQQMKLANAALKFIDDVSAVKSELEPSS